VPIWFDLDGDDLVFTIGEKTTKAANLRRDPRAAIVVDDERPPYAYVLIEGSARFSDDLAELRRWATRIGGRYMGADRAEEFGARNGVPGEVLVRLRMEKIVALQGITD
jgi:PPOX class probable F420-dependent enzyme